jgi:hypothetical protein
MVQTTERLQCALRDRYDNHNTENPMPNTLIKVYDDFSAAESVRDQLLVSGFPSSSVHLSVREDEAGPVQGNFTVGNKNPNSEGAFEMVRSMFNGSDSPYERDFADVEQRGIYMLTVDASDEDESARASEIMNQFGAPRPDRPG